MNAVRRTNSDRWRGGGWAEQSRIYVLHCLQHYTTEQYDYTAAYILRNSLTRLTTAVARPTNTRLVRRRALCGLRIVWEACLRPARWRQLMARFRWVVRGGWPAGMLVSCSSNLSRGASVTTIKLIKYWSRTLCVYNLYNRGRGSRPRFIPHGVLYVISVALKRYRIPELTRSCSREFMIERATRIVQSSIVNTRYTTY